MRFLFVLSMVYLVCCIAAIVLFVGGLIVTDIRWRLHQRKRGTPVIQDWRLP